ncbi:MAG TPA: hypothetical protein VHW02_07120 [Rhizomicrobium sp.]|nr:hypothetical protein [Rhizomicrobium sp.]
MRVPAIAAAVSALMFSAAWAASPGPQPAPATPPIPAPQDVAYPGVMKVAVDATDLTHHIFRIHETIPVKSDGPMTLLYPQWLPGAHSPGGAISMVAGLIVKANGTRLEWVRDPVQVYAYHVNVPKGATSLDVNFQYLSATDHSQGRIVMTPQMLSLQWISLSIYPAGYFTRDIMTAPSVKLPAGWKFGTALDTASTAGQVTTFKNVPYNTLTDSPMIAGKYFARVDLDPNGPAPVHLDVIADRPDELVMKPDQIAAHRALVQQAYKLFGSHHYDHYDFLFSLSDKMGGNGLEHHRSSEDGVQPKYFMDWDSMTAERDLLPHEYTHSWNGKFRRGADLWTPNFNVPMRDSLLWVYEGQTQYWGFVLAARSGLWTHQQALDAIAMTAATYDHHVGRAWKSLADTTNDPITNSRRPIPWRNWQRSEDYYSEGQLTWFDADTLIRQMSGGKKSLDDFAKLFFGINNGSYVTVTYTFDDIVKALNTVQPYDWAKFLHARLEDHAKGAPLDGITRGGYKLVYTDVESDFQKSNEKIRKQTDLSYSLGFTVDKDDTLTDVQWDSLAFKAGFTVGMKLIAVNGDSYTGDALKDAIKWAVTDKAPIALLVQDNKQYRTITLDYHGGWRYPHLVPTGTGPHTLDAILTARN